MNITRTMQLIKFMHTAKLTQLMPYSARSIRIRTLLLSVLLPWLLTQAVLAKAEDSEVKVYALNWLDRQHLDQQVERIDELARITLGTQVHNNQDDLELLQRIVNKGLISRDERLMLQAMGAVLGNQLASNLGLKWMVYEDELGRSRALCVDNTHHCLFPITMLSRRMEVGIIVNVQNIYDKAVDIITPYLPKRPYAANP